ncbi:hypothetical protein COU53_00060 [Candidatus Pacearchaeota archaeon CG10_big_fil_rev_8_21_14_0_10_30_48]|nr:MAG: hypothetical protein COU53_00060 [Candidatus Pacearchaeota archaeon CG10_big_fil_rev_8_21_14_0_10_30_48]
MEFQDISGISLGNKVVEKEGEFDFKNVGKSKIEALKKSIEEIRFLIGEREKLSQDIFHDGEKTKTEINNFLLANEKADNSLEKQDALIGLRQKKVDMTQLQLNEKVTCWKDVALLKKELRDKEQELTEKLDRMKAISDILE